MLLEGGTSSKRIPDTLQAMIAARIDRLRRNEKRLLQRAAVIGRIFWEGAVAHLMPEVEDLEPVFDDLLLRDFITRESRSSITGEHAYRFKHVLIRDVAYAGLAKGARAELHQQVADWLHEVAGEELVEIRAYHLDHAATLLEELDGEAPEELAKRAAGALEKAGRRALAQEANQVGTALARPLRRARADAPAPLPRGPGRTPARRSAGAGGRDGARLRRRDRRRRRPPPGPRADRARRERPPPRRRSSPRPRARRAGARPPRRREARGSDRGAGDPRADRLVARRPRRRRALEHEGARGRARDRAQGSRGGSRRRARELGDRAARSRSGHAARGGGARARGGERQHHRHRLGARLAGPDRLTARPVRRGCGRARAGRGALLRVRRPVGARPGQQPLRLGRAAPGRPAMPPSAGSATRSGS